MFRVVLTCFLWVGDSVWPKTNGFDLNRILWKQLSLSAACWSLGLSSNLWRWFLHQAHQDGGVWATTPWPHPQVRPAPPGGLQNSAAQTQISRWRRSPQLWPLLHDVFLEHGSVTQGRVTCRPAFASCGGVDRERFWKSQQTRTHVKWNKKK